MKKFIIALFVLVSLYFVFGCNKPKPIKLDYTEKNKQGLYDPQGLPGDSHIGAPPEDFKHSGYNPSEGREDPNQKGDTSGNEGDEKPKKDDGSAESGKDQTD